MNMNAIDRGLNGLESAASQSGHGESHDSNAAPKLSRLLVRYWRVDLARPVAARRLALDAVRARTRRGETTAASLLPFALGDVDEGIVFRATIAYVSGSGRAGQSKLPGAAIAADWIRRRLALNSAAVFAALLSLDDPRVYELLLPLRQTLAECERDAVHRQQGDRPARQIRAFLEEWAALLVRA